MAQAPQPLAPLEEHDALPLALQHAALARRPRAVCALAATCRSLRAAVRQHCAGALVLRVQLDSEQQVARLAAWLAPNGRLLRELHLAKHCIGGIDARYSWLSVAPLAAALQQAAASAPGGLQLRALVTVGGLTGAGGLLAPWLPAQQLTRLELRLSSAEQLPPFSSSQVPVLAALTGLRQLMLPGLMGGDALLPALPGLSRLSALELSKLGDAAAIASLWEQLPAQLQRLTVRQLLPVRLGLSEQRPALALGRLSALTSLDADSLMLQPGDVLPPGLAELRGVCGAASVAPLLPLAQLRLLKWKGCQAPAAQLRQLSSVGALGRPDGELQLRFWSETAADAAAAAWPLLALRQLKVGDQQLAAATLQPLAQSTNLTRLRLNDVKLEAAPSRFAGAVQCLSRLVELELCFVFFQPEQPPPAPGNGARGAAAALAAATEAAGVQLVAAVARLPRLQALHLGALEPEGLCSAAAVVQLAAATGLTSLNLRDWTQMGDVGAAAVLPALRQLQELHVECYGLTDLAVVAGLSALTWLSIETSIEVNLDLTDAGIDCLIRGLPRVAAAAADAEADEA